MTGLSISEFISQVIELEIGELIYGKDRKNYPNPNQESPYIKFLPVIVCIELLGACYDKKPFNCNDRGINCKRFNKGLRELGKRYEKFRNKSGEYSFWENVRNPMIHQCRLNRVYFGITTRREANSMKLKHLETFDNTRVLIILEDLYDDLLLATNRLIEKISNNVIIVEKPKFNEGDFFLTFWSPEIQK